MPQMSPISWTFIIIAVILFLSVVNSNVPNINSTINLNNNINLTNNPINW